MMMYHPANTWTDSHPHHAHPKTSEMNPSHINVSPMYHPWTYAGNYQHPVNPPHGCCSHTYYGGGPYCFQPHYAHYPPPSFHPHGFYSPFPGAYPVPPVELPRYDYDKNNHSPHHCCECNHRKDEKIKEESLDDNKKSDSLLLKNLPDYPIMWVPRGYTDSKVNEMEKYSHNPVLVKHHEPSNQGGNDEQGDRFPFQIFWLPSKNNEVRKDTKENNLDLLDDKGLSDEKTIQNECPRNEGECKTSSKHGIQKLIPVKQVVTNDEKKSAKAVVNSNSVEKTDNVSKASPKTSKLPPVCLRIDPLPRKKKTSRSPSPSERERSNGSLMVNDPKSSQQQAAQVLNKSQDEQVDGNIQTVDHADGDNIADHGDIVPKGEGTGSEKEKVEEKKNLTEDKAALIIQCVYRGFEVRKSQPLKKLRQIYQVRKQGFELRNRILDLESFGVDGKKEVIIGENIMSLLLKLDTIQGLHPFVREVRKSVAKELVGLQEKLDSLTSVKSETLTTCDPQQENFDQLVLLENHECKATESQYEDDAEAPNLDQQLENTNAIQDDAVAPNLDQQLENANAIQDKFETDSDTVIGKNHEVEDIGESQVGLPIEKVDEVPTECDETMRLWEVEAHQESSECGEAETHEMEAKGCNLIGEPEPESGADNDGVNMELEHKNRELDENLQIESDNVDNSSIKEDAEKNGSMVKMVSELPKAIATIDELEDIIRELRGKVKDLEKKLSKNKKIKVNKCSSRKRSRGCVVQKNIYGY